MSKIFTTNYTFCNPYKKTVIHFVFLLSICSIQSFGQPTPKFLTSINGDETGDLFSVVSYAGDLNADGYDDIIVGAPGGNYAKLFFGSAVFDTIPDMIFRCEQGGSRFGWSIAGGKDVNGDGYPDLVIGAPYFDFGGKPYGISESGKVYLYFGGPDIDTTADAEFYSEGWYYNFGHSVTLGDLNNNGLADVIAGAYHDDADAHGRVFVYYGRNIMLPDYDWLLEGTSPFDMFGASVSFAGDVNQDGYGDLLVGAPQFLLTGSRFKGGYTALFFGGDSLSFTNSILFVGDSIPPGQFGKWVVGFGDINGDNYDDVGLLASKYLNLYRGFSQFNNEADFSLNPKKSFSFLGALNDINKDGYCDFAVISDSTRIYFGQPVLENLRFVSIPLGKQISFLGDINGDGKNEIILGNNQGEGYDGPGKVFIYSVDSLAVENAVRESGHSKGFSLFQNYPNPFNGETVISFEALEPKLITIEIYNLLGQKIKILYSKNTVPGKHSIRFDSAGLPSGQYFYCFIADGQILRNTMVLIK